MRLIREFCLICIFLCATHSIEAAALSGTFQEAKSRADSLYGAEDYFPASIAYEYAYFLAANPSQRVKANLSKVQALKQVGDFQKARNDIQRSMAFTADPHLRQDVLYEAAFCAYMTGAWRESLLHIQTMLFETNDKQVHSRLRLLTWLNLLHLEDFDGLADAIKADAGSADEPEIMLMAEEILQQIQYERPVRRGEARARRAATFFPGSGHLVAGEPWKGLLNASSQVVSLGTAALLLVNGYYIGTVTVGLNLFQSFYFGGIRQAGDLTRQRNSRVFDAFNSRVGHMLITFDQKLAEVTTASNHEPLMKMVEETLYALYAFEMDKADLISQLAMERFPDHYLSYFARSSYLWWLIISGEDTKENEQLYRAYMAEAMAKSRASLASEPSLADLFHVISLYAMQARLDMKNGAYIRALRHGRHAVHHLENSRGGEDSYQGLLLTSGLYNYMTVQAGKRYPFLKVYTLFFPEGDAELGLSQLHQATQTDYPVWQTEAHYFLMRIYLEMEMMPSEALPHARWLTEQYPSNLIYQYYHLLALKALGDKTKVAEKKRDIYFEATNNQQLSSTQVNHFLMLTGQ